jgi:hypothetical protein
MGATAAAAVIFIPIVGVVTAEASLVGIDGSRNKFSLTAAT